MPDSTSDRSLLRHALSTLAYRAGKALRGAPDTFCDFRASESTRTPVKILAHMGDLMDWGHNMARGEKKWTDSAPLPWTQEVERFFAAVKVFDTYLASDASLATPVDKLFQGPLADALQHTGQLTILRRIAEAPIKGENYLAADIAVGRVGIAQTPPKREFD
jgi:hypothetical protein